MKVKFENYLRGVQGVNRQSFDTQNEDLESRDRLLCYGNP